MTTVAPSFPRHLQTAALAFVTDGIPVRPGVDFDIRRRPEATSTVPVHAVDTPVIGLFWLVGYLEERRRSRRE